MKRDHLEFLCDVGELSSILTGSSDTVSFLRNLVSLVARHLQAHVCSIYIYEESTKELVLRATVGLNPDSTEIHLRLGEGIVGTALELGRPILDNHASRNPLYKFFPDLGEERYDSFIAVPMLKGVNKIGVLVVQREERDHFREDDVTALRVVACQLVGCIENAQALIGLSAINGDAKSPTLENLLIRGRAASPGNGIGPARVLRTSRSWPEKLHTLNSDLTLEHFRGAVEQTAKQIDDMQLSVAEKLPEAVSLIFSAHLLILRDDRFVETMACQIKEGKPVSRAVLDVAQCYIDKFASSKSIHIREKAQDVEDVAVRLASNMSDAMKLDSDRKRHEIVIVQSVYPSELVMLSLEEPAGVVLVGGGATSHVSILARSLRLPLFITDNPTLLEVSDGIRVLLDGHTGNIYVAPRAEIVDRFEEQRKMRSRVHEAAPRHAHKTTCTKDGTRVRLLANINLLSEIPLARDMSAEGVGLYRTEFPFMIRSSFPDEEEQYLVYRQLVQGMEGKPVTFRTLDVGGEKTLTYYEHGREQNPELGLRAIRFSLRHRHIFRQQLRAILRAGAVTPKLRIMFPMVASLDEFREARGIVESCAAELRRQDLPSHPCPEVGMMVELPSVLETADELSRESDFFSIGSNDFIQYMVAADRGNEKVAEYYCPHHPSVLRGLARFVRAALQFERSVTVCGEMAQQAIYIPFLLGIGVRQLSVAPHRIGELHDLIQSIDLSDARQEVEALLSEASLLGIEKLLLTRVRASASPRTNSEENVRRCLAPCSTTANTSLT